MRRYTTEQRMLRQVLFAAAPIAVWAAAGSQAIAQTDAPPPLRVELAELAAQPERFAGFRLEFRLNRVIGRAGQGAVWGSVPAGEPLLIVSTLGIPGEARTTAPLRVTGTLISANAARLEEWVTAGMIEPAGAQEAAGAEFVLLADGVEPAPAVDPHDLGCRLKDADCLFRAGQYAFGSEAYSVSAELWRQATALGHDVAPSTLGYLLYFGLGVQANAAEAVRLWLGAARHGQAEAHRLLGIAAEEGNGREYDLGEAYARFLAATVLTANDPGGFNEQHNERAWRHAMDLEPYLDATELARARSLFIEHALTGGVRDPFDWVRFPETAPVLPATALHDGSVVRVNGVLSSHDPVLEGAYQHALLIRVPASERLQLRLESLDFTALLYVVSPNGPVLHGEDCFERVQVACFERAFEPGTYRVHVTSHEPYTDGSYELTISADVIAPKIELLSRHQAHELGKWLMANADVRPVVRSGGTEPRRELAWRLDAAALALDRMGLESDRLRALIQAGSLHLLAGDTETAARRLATAEDLGVDPTGISSAFLTMLGTEVHRRTGRPDLALGYAHMALNNARQNDDAQQLATQLLEVADLHSILSNGDSALAHTREAVAVATAAASYEGAALLQLGTIHEYSGARDSAAIYYYRALKAARWEGQSADEAIALNNLGALLVAAGELESGREHLEAAREILEPDGAINNRAGMLLNFASLHAAEGLLEEAAGDLTEALRMLAGPEYRLMRAPFLRNLSILHRTLGRLDLALEHLHESLDLSRLTGDQREETRTLLHVAEVSDALGRATATRLALHDAFESAGRSSDTAHEAAVHALAARFHTRLGAMDTAKTHALLAARLSQRLAAGRGPASILLNAAVAAADSSIVWTERARAMLMEAGAVLELPLSTYALASFLRDGAAADLSRALALFDTASVGIAAIRAGSGSDADRIGFADRNSTMEEWVLTWLAAAPFVGEERARLAALAALERGRAQALLDMMRMPAVLRPGEDMSAEGRLLVEQAARAGAVVLSYAVTSDTLLLFLTRSDGSLAVERRAVADSLLTRLVWELRAALGADSAAVRVTKHIHRAFQTGSPRVRPLGEVRAEISRLILPDFLENKAGGSDLVIIPHRAVSLVPFAALQLHNGSLLADAYHIRYAPSLRVLAGSEAAERVWGRRLRAADLRRALVVGNPLMPQVRTAMGRFAELDSLPGALEEARWVAGALGADVLTGADATETEVLHRMPDAPLIHLATHGFAYSSGARARDSFVALAPDDKRDGVLTMGKVLDEVPSLSAELVVLSACQTGLGHSSDAEGTVGLQRAFLARGARSVLVTLWSVDDAITTLLMTRFYTHWLGGMTKSEALRQAQDDVRRDYPEPRLWAAFQLVGAN